MYNNVFNCHTVDPSGGCGGVKCHMYASCFQDSETRKESCVCQLGFDGDGVDCQGHYLFCILLFPVFLALQDLKQGYPMRNVQSNACYVVVLFFDVILSPLKNIL